MSFMHHREAVCNVITKYPPLNECSVNKMLGAIGEMKSTFTVVCKKWNY